VVVLDGDQLELDRAVVLPHGVSPEGLLDDAVGVDEALLGERGSAGTRGASR
jgi:hypothetical protein